MTSPIVVPVPERRRPTPLLILGGSLALALIIVVAAVVEAQAIQGNAATYRPISGTAPACPTVTAEQRP